MRRVMQVGLIAVVAALASAATAVAASSPWTANPGASYDDGVVTLVNAGGAGTSYENPSLDVPVANGDTISFEYRSDDVTCAGGTPRVFIQGGAFNTFDQDPNNVTDEPACGVAIGDGWQRVTVTVSGIADGTAGHTGIVNDNPADPGTILVRELRIAGTVVPLGDDAGTGTPPASKADCKKGGWRNGPYRNQGQCVSTFAKARKGRAAREHGSAKHGHGHGHGPHGHGRGHGGHGQG